VWATKLIIAVLTSIVAVWLTRKAWFLTHPEKELDRLESSLMHGLRQAQPGRRLMTDWVELCAMIKCSVREEKPALIYRGTEVLKLFVGEFFRHDFHNPKLTAAIYRDLAFLYAALYSQHQERAVDIIIALRVAAREVADKNEAVFGDIVRQFTLYGLLALRERQAYFITAQILDQLFLLISKCAGDGKTSQLSILLEAIASIGQGAVKRRDSGLIRETLARLLRLQETLGRKIHEPIYVMLLKSVRLGSVEIVDLVLEASFNVLMTEHEDDARQTLKIWSEAAQSSLVRHDDQFVQKMILQLTRVVEEQLPTATLAKITLDEIFAIIFQAIPKREFAEPVIFLLPVLELGCYCMQRELKCPVNVDALENYRLILKHILDKLLYAGMMVTRNGQITTGAWVTGIYQHWIGLPDKIYGKDAILKFIHLWLLYWSNNQLRSAKKQGGIPIAMFEQPALTPEDIAKFPNLGIRQT